MSIPQWIFTGFIFLLILNYFGSGFFWALKDDISTAPPKNLLSDKLIILIFILSASSIYYISSHTTFENEEDCFAYIKKSGNMNKAQAGAASCRLIFFPEVDARSRENRIFGQCILDNFKSITDDASGTKVSTNCAESTNNYRLGVWFSTRFFSQATRIEEALEEHRREIQNNIQEQQIESLLGIANDGVDGPFLLERNGITKLCMKTGPIINCD